MKKQLLAAVWLVVAAMTARAATPDDLSKLSVDDLMNVEVTSVARRGQKLSETAAAVFVITRDDIARSGATTIPEVLRMVPGLDVASIDGAIWAVSARGFNDRWSNKLLVIIDGRSIYTPTFSGVYWDTQDTMLEDVDRIEVIRGPGGTLWGANAVNGVISIITRNSIETQGAVATMTTGTTERASTSLRYGGSAGDNLHYRVFAKAFDREANVMESGLRAADHWDGRRAGFRADWLTTPRDTIMAEGEVFHERSGEIIALVPPGDPLRAPVDSHVDQHGGNMLLRWTQTQSKRSETALQAYFDFGHVDSPVAFSEKRRLFDVDFQQRLSPDAAQTMVWGAAYRHSSAGSVSVGDVVTFDRNARTTDLVSAFVEDELRLRHHVQLSFGTKVQRDRHFGTQWQPTLRALWRPNEHHAFWAAFTDAVRTPSAIETGGHVALGGFAANGSTVLITADGRPDLRAERTRTFEAGYRWMRRNVSFDVATFREKLQDLVDLDAVPLTVNPDGTLHSSLEFTNAIRGLARGIEVSANSFLGDRIELRAGYALYHLDRADPIDNDITIGDSSPSHQIQLSSTFALTPSIEIDTAAYCVSQLRDVPSYIRFDSRVTWHASSRWDISLVGQNLFDDKHREWIGSDGATATPINRAIYGKVTWHSR